MPHQRVGDVELYYEVSGQGPPLMLLHGLGSSSEGWRVQVEAFAGSYQVIVPDLRGHGRSAKPPGPYRMAGLAGDIAGLIRALETGPVHVAGLSLGGMVAFQLAVTEPGLVRSLVIVNSTPEVALDSLRDWLRALERRLLVRLFGLRVMGWVLGRRLFPRPDQQRLRRLFAEHYARNDKAAYLASLHAILGWSVSEHLERIRCPVLVVTGSNDYTSVASKQAYTNRLPDAALVVIPDSRHATPVDRPQAFNAVLEAFLAEQEDGA